MLEFGTPELLWLLPAPALLFLALATRRRPAVRFPSLNLVAGLPGGRARFARWLPPAWRSLALGLGLLAAAGPRVPDPDSGERLSTEGVAICLAVDVSGSMAERDFAGGAGGEPVSRLEAAARAVRLFVGGGSGPGGEVFAGRPGDLIGLVIFARWPTPACPLTLSHSALLEILDAAEPAGSLDDGTNVGDAIAQAVLLLRAAGDRPKVLVLLSDGEHNLDLEEPRKPLTPGQAARLAEAFGVKVYAIDAGGEPDPKAPGDRYSQRRSGRESLKAVARATDGRWFAADDAGALLAAYAEIDALEHRPVESFRYRRYREVGPWLGLAAAAVILTGYALEWTAFRQVP